MNFPELKNVSWFKLYIGVAANMIFNEALTRLGIDVEDEINLRSEDQRKELASNLIETVDNIKNEWIEKSMTLPDSLPDDFGGSGSNFEGWVLAHHEVLGILLEEAILRVIARHGFEAMGYEDYMNMFPEDMKDAAGSEIREMYEMICEEWKVDAADAFYKRLFQDIEEAFEIKMH